MTALRLSVWNPLRHSRELQYLANAEGESESQVDKNEMVFTSERLAEEMYSWSPEVDIWNGLLNEEVRENLRREFLQAFSASLPPANRGLDKLAKIIAQIEAILADDQTSAWMNTTRPIDDSPGGETLFRVSPTLGFVIHLRWIFETFRDVPGLSITVR
jgi:hypothetical protein